MSNPEPIQSWLIRNFDEKMADYRLVELEGNCFFQHKTREYVLVCAYCVEECKRYHLVHIPPKESSVHRLMCHRCKVNLFLNSDPKEATPVENGTET